jgi:phenylalanyl-tRNA synthetase beta subunit
VQAWLILLRICECRRHQRRQRVRQGIEPGKKSIAIAVTIQPRDKTMTDAEIEALASKIVAEVGKRTGGVLRA